MSTKGSKDADCRLVIFKMKNKKLLLGVGAEDTTTSSWNPNRIPVKTSPIKSQMQSFPSFFYPKVQDFQHFQMFEVWASAEIFPGWANVDILPILFRILWRCNTNGSSQNASPFLLHNENAVASVLPLAKFSLPGSNL